MNNDQRLLDRANAMVELQDLHADPNCAVTTLREARGEITEAQATQAIIDHHLRKQ